jgi:hypothetical protein
MIYHNLNAKTHARQSLDPAKEHFLSLILEKREVTIYPKKLILVQVLIIMNLLLVQGLLPTLLGAPNPD